MIDPVFKQEHDFARCKYPSKICRNVRTRKRNGQLHRFCEEHRTRANQNQKRWSASRQKRWDTLAQELGDGYEPLVHDEPEDDDDNDRVTPADALAGHFPMLSLDDCYYDHDGELTFDASPLEAASTDLSWQDAATDELREFLGDLLLSIASDETPHAYSQPAPQPQPQPVSLWPTLW